MIEWDAGVWISLLSSACTVCILNKTQAYDESQIPSTDISRGTEKWWLHQTYIHPTQACFLPTNYTKTSTLSPTTAGFMCNNRQSAGVTLLLHQYYRTIPFQFNMHLCRFQSTKSHNNTSLDWPPDDWKNKVLRRLPRLRWKQFVWWNLKILQTKEH